MSEDDNTMHTSNASDVDMKQHPPPLNEEELNAAGVYLFTLTIQFLLKFLYFQPKNMFLKHFYLVKLKHLRLYNLKQ